MATLHDILQGKQGHPLHSIAPEATALDAVHRMNDHKIGALLVMDAGRLVGIFTERDVLRRVVGEHRAPDEVSVEEVMSTEVACGTSETTVDEARAVMKHRRIRHLPVVDPHGAVQGLISIGDLNAFETNSQEVTIHFLNEYLHGRV